MKKLFLTSFASVSLGLIKDLLPKLAHEMKVAFIPTAGDPYDKRDFVDSDRDSLVEMGFVVKDVDIKALQGVELEKEFDDIDIIFVAGGNTFYLLDQVKKSGFDEVIKKLVEDGVIYIGSSAGSALCCPTIEYVKRFDDPGEAPELIDYAGLNLFSKIIIPHAQKEKYSERINQTIEEMENKGYEIITLSDEQMVVVNGDQFEVVG